MTREVKPDNLVTEVTFFVNFANYDKFLKLVGDALNKADFYYRMSTKTVELGKKA